MPKIPIIRPYPWALLVLLFLPGALLGQIYQFSSRNGKGNCSVIFQGVKNPGQGSVITEKTAYRLADSKLISLSDGQTLLPSRQNPITASGVPQELLLFIPPDSLIGVRLYLTRVEIIGITGDHTNSDLDSVTVDELDVQSDARENMIDYLHVQRSRIKKLMFFNVQFPPQTSNTFRDLDLQNSILDSLFVTNSTVSGQLSFNDMALPKYIYLTDINFKGPASVIDLTHFRIGKQQDTCVLTIKDMGDGIGRIKLNYENFRLDFDSTAQVWQREQIYKQLLEQQQKDGFTFGFQRLDKEYKRFKYLKDNKTLGKFENWLDSHWWDYGYDKFKVVTNSLWLFLIFFAINLALYSWMIRIYVPEKLKELDGRLTDQAAEFKQARGLLFFLLRVPAVFVYTFYLFWGVRLEIKEMEVRNPPVFAILIIEYVSGLICLAYIANFIITK